MFLVVQFSGMAAQTPGIGAQGSGFRVLGGLGATRAYLLTELSQAKGPTSPPLAFWELRGCVAFLGISHWGLHGQAFKPRKHQQTWMCCWCFTVDGRNPAPANESLEWFDSPPKYFPWFSSGAGGFRPSTVWTAALSYLMDTQLNIS